MGYPLNMSTTLADLEQQMPTMQPFVLYRNEDITGISGTGVVAQGILFQDGKVVLRWVVGDHRSTVVWDSMKAVEEIHGHGGATTIIYGKKVHLT